MSKQNELVNLARTGASGGGSKNMVINGDMRIDQRNSGSLVTVTNSADTFCPDRFRFTENHSGTFTIQQVSDAPVGFEYSSKITVTGTDSSLAATEFARILQGIEGQNISHLNWGSSNAKTCTLSFYVKSSVTGQYYVSINNNSTNRNMLKGYTIDTANTWEKKEITIIGDQTGTWNTNNLTGIYIMWTLGTGSNYQSSTVDAYQSGFFMGASDQTNLAATASATWQLAGVQFEVGEKATDFEHRSYGDELFRCQRYYEQWDTVGGENVVIGTSYSGNNPHAVVHMKVIKRAAPTVTLPPAGISTGQIAFLTGTGSTTSTIGTHSTNRLNTRSIRVAGTGYGGISSSQPSTLYAYGGASSFKFDAEL